MKRIALLVILVSLAAVGVMGQDVGLQLAVATQALNQNMLSDLGLTQTEADEILALQEQFRLRKEQSDLEMNVIKAQIAQKLYYADANTSEIGRRLEEASQLRLTLEKDQVETYLLIRNQLGEDHWSELMQRVRAQKRARQQEQEDSGTRTRNNSNSSPSGGSGSSGSGSSSSSGRGGN
jgi:hypothetical protein